MIVIQKVIRILSRYSNLFSITTEIANVDGYIIYNLFVLELEYSLAIILTLKLYTINL